MPKEAQGAFHSDVARDAKSPRVEINRLLLAVAIAMGVLTVVAIAVFAARNSSGPIGDLVRRLNPSWIAVQVPVAIMVLPWIGRHLLFDAKRRARSIVSLAATLEEVRRGEAPIEALTDVRGPLSPLAAVFANMARDLRAQEKQVAELSSEIHQRVRHRTDALERSIAGLRSQATRDALTGLYNRRMFDEHLPRLLEQCHCDNQKLCVMMLDVDNFKLLNDTLGHSAGDDLLRSIGHLIRSTIRDTDVPFRNGGDEFVVLLPNCDSDAGQSLARRVASLVDQLAKPMRLPRKPGLSIGIVCMTNLNGVTPQSLMQAADAAMYQDKSARKQSRLAKSA